MLSLLKKKKKDSSKIYIGDKLNLIYRFKGVFFVVLGITVVLRSKSIGVYSKKKGFFLIFSSILKNIRNIYKFDTYFFHSIKWKILYRKY